MPPRASDEYKSFRAPTSRAKHHSMPYLGVDWRGGDAWIRTEFGWKRLAEVSTSLRRDDIIPVGHRGSVSTARTIRTNGTLRTTYVLEIPTPLLGI